MAEAGTQKRSNWLIVAIWAAILLVVFVAFRSSDLLRLPQLVGNLGGGALFGSGVGESVAGALIAVVIAFSWFGLGSVLTGFIREPETPKVASLQFAEAAAVGAAVWSLAFFFLGVAGLYRPAAGVAAAAAGCTLGVYVLMRTRRAEPDGDARGTLGTIALVLIGIALAIAFIGSLAPPIAKDTLLYHFAVPKAFAAQGSNAFVDGNIASYLALGTEMHVVWAMLVGGLFGPRAAEAASGATVLMFFPLLLRAVYGWARQLGVNGDASRLAALTIAAVPTAFHIASSGYIDIALAVYVVLATAALGRWWRQPSNAALILVALLLGAALSIKLTAVFVIAAFALVILLRARSEPASAARLVAGGLGALVLAGVIGSPWYLRNWAATGSPVFPFYMSIWKGTANGWDVERSSLFQLMNSRYGGASENATNYLTAPLRVSLAAQPENPELYDGVLGSAFLIGLPLLIWALWKRRLAVDLVIAAGVAGVVYLFWLFSSPQLRYLLPIVPLIAVGIAAAIDSDELDVQTRSAWRYSLAGASAIALLTGFAWFCLRAPLRVVLGGETRDDYLARNLDHYPYYSWLNTSTDAGDKVWLINMRRDTYHLDRPAVSDYLFEDWTLRQMAWGARNTQELRAMAASLGIKYILARHDFLLDEKRSTLIDDKKAAESQQRIRMVREILLDPQRVVRSDEKFSLVKVF